MRLETFYIFIETAKVGSMKKVAEKYFFSPQHVSKSIKELEEWLSVKLFIRTSKGLQLTTEGNLAFDLISDICCKTDHLQSAFDNKSSLIGAFSNDKTPIKLAFSGDFSNYVMDVISILSSYAQLIPSVTVKESADLISSINDELYDLLLTCCTSNHTLNDTIAFHNYQIFNICSSKIYLHVMKDDPLASKAIITFSDLEKLPLAFYRTNDEIDPLYLQLLKNNNLNLNIVFSSTSTSNCSSFVNKYKTYNLISELTLCNYRAQKKDSIAIPIEGLPPINQVLIVKKPLANTTMMQELISYLRKYLYLLKTRHQQT